LLITAMRWVITVRPRPSAPASVIRRPQAPLLFASPVAFEAVPSSTTTWSGRRCAGKGNPQDAATKGRRFVLHAIKPGEIKTLPGRASISTAAMVRPFPP
jgi:hypothetical protein